MKPIVIAVAGVKKSGKTTLIVGLIHELAKRGFTIAAVKHIPEAGFTIDQPGKDTWRYAQAGAQIVLAVSPNETAILKKTDNLPSIDSILRKCQNSDIVLVEGFKHDLAKNSDVQKIIVAGNLREAKAQAKSYNPLLAIVGPFRADKQLSEWPHVISVEDSRELADIIQKHARKD